MMSKDTKFRKTIRSNPWGFRIHSPYVYRLVAKGIFGKTTLKPYEMDLLKMSDKQKKIRRIINFIRYIKPVKISISGGTGDVPFMDILKNSQERNSPENQKDDLPGKCDLLHIFYKIPRPVPIFSAHDILLLPELNDPEARRLFKDMQVLKEVSVTIETQMMGIVFFDPLLQKEHYLIRSWFYLCE
jgi:hypothetical protein